MDAQVMISWRSLVAAAAVLALSCPCDAFMPQVDLFLTLLWCKLDNRFGEPGLFSAPKLMDLYHEIGMDT